MDVTDPGRSRIPAPPPGAPPAARPRVAASSCLLGEPVRYNGGHSRNRFLTDLLAGHVDWVEVCPEVEIGLGVPRPTVRLTTQDHLVSKDGGADHTAAMTGFAARRIATLGDLDGYVLKARSPSCGLHGLPRHASGLPGERTDGQPVDRRGRGVFAARLVAARPGLPVEEDGRLGDPLLREHFVERIFARSRLRALFTQDWRSADLVGFHSRHKLQLLAHDPEKYRELGRIVAQAGSRDRAELEAGYRRVFDAALAVRPKRGRQVNALHHMLGLLSERLDPVRRHDLMAAIESYHCGEAPLSLPIALLRHRAAGEAVDYLTGQTYLEPFPADLILRHHL